MLFKVFSVIQAALPIDGDGDQGKGVSEATMRFLY